MFVFVFGPSIYVCTHAHIAYLSIGSLGNTPEPELELKLFEFEFGFETTPSPTFASQPPTLPDLELELKLFTATPPSENVEE